MTGRWGVVAGGVQPGGRWNGEVPAEEEGALGGERDRLVGDMWSLAMARWLAANNIDPGECGET